MPVASGCCWLILNLARYLRLSEEKLNESAVGIAKQAALVSERLNNLLTGIALKAGLLGQEIADSRHRKGLQEIVALCKECEAYTTALRELAERYNRET